MPNNALKRSEFLPHNELGDALERLAVGQPVLVVGKIEAVWPRDRTANVVFEGEHGQGRVIVSTSSIYSVATPPIKVGDNCYATKQQSSGGRGRPRNVEVAGTIKAIDGAEVMVRWEDGTAELVPVDTIRRNPGEVSHDAA